MPLVRWFVELHPAGQGAMIYVVVEELIPESQAGSHGDYATLGALGGFAIMMVLDVALA